MSPRAAGAQLGAVAATQDGHSSDGVFLPILGSIDEPEEVGVLERVLEDLDNDH